MPEVGVPSGSHLGVAVRGLLQAGWRLQAIPTGGQLRRNGQLIHLSSPSGDLRIRLWVYKVTVSSRGKPQERRVEITSTYLKNLSPRRDYLDVVLGYAVQEDVLVGIDSRRLSRGGPTANASSFFDRTGLAMRPNDPMRVLPRATKVLPGGIEEHAFLKPHRLAEYLYNLRAIHAGTYRGQGPYSGIRRGRIRRVSRSQFILSERDTGGDILKLVGPPVVRRRLEVRKATIEAVEVSDVARLRALKITPQEFAAIQARMDEHGRLGEEFVLDAERRRLRRAGKGGLAARVRWVSQESITYGYDISSFDASGHEKLIEVKTTARPSRSFEMSNHEWETARRKRQSYWIYRVVGVPTAPKIALELVDPHNLESTGSISKTPTGWRVIVQGEH